MFSDKIYKHFFSELSKHFFIVLFALSAVVWAVQSVNFLDLIVEDGHSVFLYLKYSFLNVVKILTKFIPLSFLISIIMTIEKFDGDNELMALWTAGLSKIKIINFFFKVSILVTLLQLFLACIVNPLVLNHSRSLIKSSDINFVTGTIKTNQFNDTVAGLTIFVEEKSDDGYFKNIFIRELVRDESKLLKLNGDKSVSNLTIFAKKAKLIEASDSLLVLEKGTIHSEQKGGKVKVINFEKTKLNLSGMKTKSITQAKVQETTSKTLIDCFFNNDQKNSINCPAKKKYEVLAEINRRFGMPLYIPFISLLCSFLLINREESKFGGFFKYLYGGIALTTLITAEILVRYSGLSYYYSLVYYLFPLVFIPILYLEILRKFSFRT
tara:strand:- start:24536 stop:25678 length:1143 start_codon:yes stop_codon:yes gene_type:complete